MKLWGWGAPEAEQEGAVEVPSGDELAAYIEGFMRGDQGERWDELNLWYVEHRLLPSPAAEQIPADERQALERAVAAARERVLPRLEERDALIRDLAQAGEQELAPGDVMERFYALERFRQEHPGLQSREGVREALGEAGLWLDALGQGLADHARARAWLDAGRSGSPFLERAVEAGNACLASEAIPAEQHDKLRRAIAAAEQRTAAVHARVQELTARLTQSEVVAELRALVDQAQTLYRQLSPGSEHTMELLGPLGEAMDRARFAVEEARPPQERMAEFISRIRSAPPASALLATYVSEARVFMSSAAFERLAPDEQQALRDAEQRAIDDSQPLFAQALSYVERLEETLDQDALRALVEEAERFDRSIKGRGPQATLSDGMGGRLLQAIRDARQRLEQA